MTLVDTHFHPMDESFDADLPDVVARARLAGVTTMIAIGFDVGSSRRAGTFAEHYGQYAVAGLHPYEASTASEQEVQDIERLLRHPAYVAVGEIGLDYARAEASHEAQAWLFRRQLALAKAHDRPVVLHVRDAYDDALDIMTEMGTLQGVLHCFAGTARQAERALDLGLMISFTGMVTFKKNTELLQLAAGLPVERIMVETDAPYLAPVPYRGKRNEPAYVSSTLNAIAQAKQVDAVSLAAQTTENATRFFRLLR